MSFAHGPIIPTNQMHYDTKQHFQKNILSESVDSIRRDGLDTPIKPWNSDKFDFSVFYSTYSWFSADFLSNKPKNELAGYRGRANQGGQKRAIVIFHLECITQYCRNFMSYFLYKSSFYTARSSVLTVWACFFLTFDSSFTNRLLAICHFVHYCTPAMILLIPTSCSDHSPLVSECHNFPWIANELQWQWVKVVLNKLHCTRSTCFFFVGNNKLSS